MATDEEGAAEPGTSPPLDEGLALPTGAPALTARERIVGYARANPNATTYEIAAALGTKPGSTGAVLSRWRHGHFADLEAPPGAPGFEPDFIACELRCICRCQQTETLPGDEPVRDVLAKIACRACGHLGRMRIVPALERGMSNEPNDGRTQS